MIKNIAWKAYKAVYLHQTQVMDKVLGFAISKTNSRNKLLVLNAYDDINEKLKSEIAKHYGFSTWLDFCLSQEWQGECLKLTLQVAQAIHNKDRQIRREKLGLQVVA